MELDDCAAEKCEAKSRYIEYRGIAYKDKHFHYNCFRCNNCNIVLGESSPFFDGPEGNFLGIFR
jgi:hypothetical protein